MITPARLVPVVLATQAGLATAAIVGAQMTGLRFTWGRPRDLLLGCVVGGGLAAANVQLLARPHRLWRGLRAAADEVLIPTFVGLSRPQIVALSLAAGVGEELFFRGFLQPLLGVVMASLAFGAAHVAGARLLAFGVWAAGMGFVLGGLMAVTGGVIASMAAHAVYDVLAFDYLSAEGRRQASMRSVNGEGW